MKKPVVLMILDGFGLSDQIEGNAIKEACTPNIDLLMENYPFVKGNASGLAVGLPEGQMGNSEVGHLNIGAGRIVYQELTRITKEIHDGDFFQNKALVNAIENCKKNGTNLHLMGLLSNGGVHSDNKHLYGLLELADKENFSNVYIHSFLDGRDTPPDSGVVYMEELIEKTKEIGVGKIASVSGRYYAMDRDNRWERTQMSYDSMVKSEGEVFSCPLEGIRESYKKGIQDEFIIPFLVSDTYTPVKIKKNDSVIFFNFRPDRARQMTRAFCDDEFVGFSRGERIQTHFVCFTNYDITIENKEVAFGKVEIKNTFGEYLGEKGLKQLRLAETEKYAHVTFFFNGGVEEPNPEEERILVSSPKVSTYDLQPEMSANKVCDELVKAVEADTYDVIVVNFANPDMVGHTGIMEAVVRAIEVVDQCVGRAMEVIAKKDGLMFLLADHGNAEQLIDPLNGGPFTAHTINPVPFILYNAGEGYSLKEGGCLADVVPTLIDLMGLEKPKEMTGKSLLVK